MSQPGREEVLALLASLAATPLGPHLVLAGSSGLFGASLELPALTEDVDLAVDERWLRANEASVLEHLSALGYRHIPETCTFVAESGATIDLIGYDDDAARDRVGGGARVPVMVFGDLGLVLGHECGTQELPQGGRTMTPAALVVSKLLTVRLEKGGKDKVQALLLLDENVGDERFRNAVGALLARVERDRLEDAFADAQAALLALTSDPLAGDREARGYASFAARAARGLALLRGLGSARGGGGVDGAPTPPGSAST